MSYRRVHMVGIGGAGMSAIARVLLERGVEVSGSDLKASPVTEDLARRGARIFLGHAGEYVGDVDCVVVSSAVAPDNPEVEAARNRGIPLWPRARMMAELTRGTRAVAVAGTHGKTTTTSMVAFILEQAGLDPTVFIGGELPAFGSNARAGRGPYSVMEADESDRSFLFLSPHIAVVTNVEEDHLERFAGIDDIADTFAAFLHRLPEDGLAVLCGDDPRLRALAEGLPRRTVFFSLREGGGAYWASHIQLRPFGSSFSLWVQGESAGTLSLAVPGRHNIANALAAVAVAREIGIPLERAKAALAAFRSPARRFDVLGELAGVLVVDDYAHHPTEVRATLSAARTTGRRVVAVFQPHRYTRTQRLGHQFAHCFSDADVIVVTEIYGAGEDPIPGVDAVRLARRIEAGAARPVVVIPELEAVAPGLLPHIRPGDLVLTMGAGNVRQVGIQLLELLARSGTGTSGGRDESCRAEADREAGGPLPAGLIPGKS